MNKIGPLQDFDEVGFDPSAAYDLTFGESDKNTVTLRDIAARGPVQEGDLRVLMGMEPDANTIGTHFFVAAGYEAVRQVLTNPDLYSVEHYRAGLNETFGDLALSTLDAPEHTRYRRIYQKAFLPHMLKSWSGIYVEPALNDLMDQFVPLGHGELMKTILEPFPFNVVYNLLELPRAEADVFYRMSVALLVYPVDIAHGREAHDKLGTYFLDVIRARRQNPGTDLVSVLATTEVDDDRLPDEAILSFLRQLLIAGGDTTYRSSGSMMVGLLSELPDQLEMIRQDRSLIAKAIEETVRWEGPVTVIFRSAKEDNVLGGVKIPKGGVVQCVLGLADRDPNVYENPDSFDILRPMPRAHMGFAAGPHICLGQHLARLEMTLLLNALLDRTPKLRLDPAYPKPEVRGWSMRCPKEIHVRFD